MSRLLTKREREVWASLPQGHSAKQIGRNLGISEGTVRNHLRMLYFKLNVTNQVQAAVNYVRAHG